MYMSIFFNKNWGNSASKTREKPYYGKNSRTALVSSIPLNIMEQVIADLVSIFRLQNFTQEVEIYYIGSVYGLSLPYLKLNNDVKQFCTCVNKIKQTIID
jgi:hypothetical protein